VYCIFGFLDLGSLSAFRASAGIRTKHRGLGFFLGMQECKFLDILRVIDIFTSAF